MKVNINIPDELLAQIDEKAHEMYITRTSLVITAITQKLQGDVLVEQLADFIPRFNRR